MTGREVELEPTDMAHGGVTVARLDGRVVFLPDAIPGERMLARITDDRKAAFWRAEAVRVLEPSEHRRPHVWAEASIDRAPGDRAGGADYGHIALEHQRRLKGDVLADALRRMGKVDPAVFGDGAGPVVEPLPGDADGTGWRTRVRLQVDDDGRPGPFAARSHTVVAVDSLPLATGAVRDAAPLDQRFPGIRHLDVLAPSGGASAGDARLIIGDQAPTAITELVGEREFRLDDGGFWQVHRHAAVTLSAAVQDAIDEDLFDPKAANLDLYGGVGLLAAAVGDRFGPGVRITTVESDERATEHAAENLADWLGAAVVTARVERWVRGLADASAAERERLAAATVVLDPPRAGAGRQVLEALAAVAPAQLVYVACDPVAFARDVAVLDGLGYRLVGLRAFDLFPSTHHVEAVGAFRRGT